MRKRILHYYVLAIGAAVAVTGLLLVLVTNRLFENRVIDDLKIYARLVCGVIERGDEEFLPSLEVDSLRITLIDTDGAVQSDNYADPAQMESHADREEVLRAIEQGEGWVIRDSQTLRHSTFYYAVLLTDGRVLRIAQEAFSIWSMYMSVMPTVLIVLLAMSVACYGAASALTQHMIRPIEEASAHLDDMSALSYYPELEPFLRMIKNQHEEILRSADMRVEFTANVSHELKTPLTSISGYAELIESGMAEGEQAIHFAHEIRKGANRLLSLINDIIRLSQLDSGVEQAHPENVDLAAVAEEVADRLGMSAERNGVSLRVEASRAVVYADRWMMEELMHNLIDNAIRYNVRGGTVLAKVSQKDGAAELMIEDTGIGIDKAHIDHIFERFYRVDKSRSKETGGTGLGLAIVKHIAACHHASIALDSAPGRGTKITVTFPNEKKTEN